MEQTIRDLPQRDEVGEDGMFIYQKTCEVVRCIVGDTYYKNKFYVIWYGISPTVCCAFSSRHNKNFIEHKVGASNTLRDIGRLGT